jgi:DNA-directed RNA polymerase beta subunit
MKTKHLDRILNKVRGHAIEKRAKASLAPSVVRDLDDDDDYDPVGLDGILASTEKILSINRGQEPPDERDSLVFKKIFTTDKLLRERIKLDADKVRKNITRRVSKSRNLKPISPFSMDGYMTGQLLGNPLSMPLEEINPMQLVEQSRRITGMGPGGLGSEQAITSESQNIHPSQFGFISGLEGPESSRAGVDVRVTWGTKVGDDGRLYQLVTDRATKRNRWASPQDLDGATLAFPD